MLSRALRRQARWALAWHCLGRADRLSFLAQGLHIGPSVSRITCTLSVAGCRSLFLTLQRWRGMWEGPRRTWNPNLGSQLMKLYPWTNCFAPLGSRSYAMNSGLLIPLPHTSLPPSPLALSWPWPRFRKDHLFKYIQRVSGAEQTAWECEEELAGLPGRREGVFLPRLRLALAWGSRGRLHRPSAGA